MSVPEARDATTELGNIIARGSTCKLKTKTMCTSCPKPKVKKGKCPKGAKCKRDVEPRIVVGMDSIASGQWSAGQLLETGGLSACSVMAVYDQNSFVMAHIPPARASGNPPTLVDTSIQVINEYTGKMTTKFNAARMVGARGVLLVSNLMGHAEQNAMRQWFASVGVQVSVQTYNPNDAIQGSGNLVISRETGTGWPPSVSFA